MKRYGVFGLALNLQTLMACRDSLLMGDHRQVSVVDDDLARTIAGLLNRLKSNCEEFQADSSLVASIAALAQKLESGTADRRMAVILARVDVIKDAIENNLEKRHFMLFSEEEATFYSNPDLFGESFKAKYSMHAMREAFDAGNCYAASQYTACVFHCMRVAEYGLRALARNSFLKVKLTHKGKPHPIEYADWQKVIDAIRSKIVKIRQRPVGPKRAQDLQFLSSAADHCEYMKDIWRNEISHTRRWYKKEEALSAINRVKEFVIAVGDHKGSLPAEDSVMSLIERAKKEAEAQLAASQSNPALPSSI